MIPLEEESNTNSSIETKAVFTVHIVSNSKGDCVAKHSNPVIEIIDFQTEDVF